MVGLWVVCTVCVQVPGVGVLVGVGCRVTVCCP